MFQPKHLTEAQRTALREQRKKDLDTVREFVEHSARISSVEFSDPSVWESMEIKRHLEIAEILLLDAHQLNPVGLINSDLTGRRNNWFRTGRDAAAKKIPHGSHVRQLVAELDAEIKSGVERLKANPEAERAALAQYAHDMLLCISPFWEMNSRTARLFLNHTRKMLNLPILVIKYEESGEYLARFEAFQQTVFLPKYGALIEQPRPLQPVV
ncbi:MAG: Fic family protein [Candidatus Pacebacteria bacterium]|nr:Fic family protein [Candidatus Paceibacterota bacterium]